MSPNEYLKGKKVLVVVLGIHGGGVATAKWLFAHGAKVSVTDLRTADELAASLKKFTPKERSGISFVLGGQHEKDFQTHDIVVLGPGVPRESKYLAAAVKAKRDIQNDASLFFKFTENQVIAVTGTRGKTTTTHWIAELLSKKYGPIVPTGNNPKNPFLAELRALEKTKDKKRPVVVEASSWQLEYAARGGKAPHVAVITNIFPDHLNRYGGSIEAYAKAKAEIFRLQDANDTLILNADNRFTSFFLKRKPKARIQYFSMKPLAKNRDGMFADKGALWWKEGKEVKKICSIKTFAKERGEHSVANVMAAILSVRVLEPRLNVTESQLRKLPGVYMRQEVVLERKGLKVVNDSTATSPDGTIAAIKTFAGKSTVFIVGGTNKDLSFDDLAKEVKCSVPPSHLVLLGGSATDGLVHALSKKKYFGKTAPQRLETLKECVERARGIIGTKGTIVFSPGAASFEKFKNEFDRGEQFNKLAKEIFARG
ncbi:MAG: UDP-N-acetylmuramoylalanine--D-glutamate ligase [Candidatus Yonathbacteria bacterium RIFOXYC1_FULL_52_10]|uniref:UDP-N-acetylmuramoylalanine--D-glutamate ligase n=1 Tax=Candidatus Yonathbacteria bacterium RIFOXYD1_FULL_52_36 TaxID=1802730 RepID=A0A1G2SN35_9BACT|nr:MAG: UDP-N-acetylmuramoylalanine--D-glutamate ligase [Candidatus Yonathbacteria bacterium RIFOXYC1_FULL_52_10]OHA86039.1 MAG: UDP-N-acetylmuramoylalanine--D-glutamate ligase [Candidatus Yonathbacteria bacterium RIFOXYD1_FULL_52_36]